MKRIVTSKMMFFFLVVSMISSFSFSSLLAQNHVIPLSDIVSKKLGLNEDYRFTEAWNEINNPAYFGDYAYRLADLSQSGEASNIPWSDSYYPTSKGGVATRWQRNDPTEHFDKDKLDVYSYKKIKKNPKLIDTLSPTEKYDIFKGNFDYPLTTSEYNRTKDVVFNSKDRGWFGLCHASATASYIYKEPKKVTLRSEDGLKVTFYPSDIKALLMFIQDNGSTTDYYCGTNCGDGRVVGRRCGEDYSPNNIAFRDVNPATFHVVLTNEIGRLKHNFSFDRDSGAQVWNNAIYSYTINKMEETPMSNLINLSSAAAKVAPGTKTVYIMNTSVQYAKSVAPSRTRRGAALGEETYSYTLELNENGDIIGGEWLDDSVENHPDFLWASGQVEVTDDYMRDLIDVIYKKSL